MKFRASLRAGAVGACLALGLASPIIAQTQSASVQNAEGGIVLGVGKGTLVRLPQSISDVFVANNKIADVQVRSATQVYVFGVAAGETSVYATNRTGKVVYSATVRVGQNSDQIKSMLGLAMPGAAIDVTPMNGLVLLTGTVASPGEVEEATRLVQAFVGKDQSVVTKLKTATPMQVNLQVKIVEMSRDMMKQFGVSILTRDTTDGFRFGISSGRNVGSIGDADLSAFPKLDASGLFGLPRGSLSLPFDPRSGQFLFGGTDFKFSNPTGPTTFNLAGKLFGLDILTAIDLLESDGVVSTLAEPNLTALSGETASFLAGGEIPIPVNGGNNQVTVEYKPYGVGLAFTPTVIDGNRIAMRVRPEVSELSDAGSVVVNGFRIPGLITRRAETMVELGSGQSFMIAGLLSNGTSTATDKTPILGDLPILGALFKSDKYQRQETELVIVITPYLVKPVSADKIKLPTDGYQAPTDFQRWMLGKTFDGKSDAAKPGAKVVPPAGAPATPASNVPAPGFSLN